MIFGTPKRLFVKTGTIQEKRPSKTLIAKYRGTQHVTTVHRNLFVGQFYRKSSSNNTQGFLPIRTHENACTKALCSILIASTKGTKTFLLRSVIDNCNQTPLSCTMKIFIKRFCLIACEISKSENFPLETEKLFLGFFLSKDEQNLTELEQM